MKPKFDQRSFNITNVDEAMAFVNLVASKLPQINVILKKARMATVVANNQVAAAQSQAAAAAQALVYEDPNNPLSVADRISGKRPVPQSPANMVSEAEQNTDRLAQLRKAQIESEITEDETTNLPDLTPPTGPPKPGQIGQLNVAPPVDTTILETTAPDVPETLPEDERVPADELPQSDDTPAEDDIDLDDLLNDETPEEIEEEDIETISARVVKAQKQSRKK